MRQQNRSVSASRVWNMVAAMLMCIVATCSFSSCSESDPSPYNPDYSTSRTVMIYMVAENSMYNAAPADLREMLLTQDERQAFYSDDRVVVYVDDMDKPRIYVIDRNTSAQSLKEFQPVQTYDEDVNSASAEQLGVFIDYVKENYPADSYGLVMWSHSSGWLPSTYSGDNASVAPRRSFGIDNGHNDTNTKGGIIDIGHQMNISDMARVLEAKGGVDFIFFDACFMQSVEVAYELRNATKHVIASPAEIPYDGANYTTMLPAMFYKDNVGVHMLDAYYQEYTSPAKSKYGIVISDVNTSALPAFATYMKQLVRQYKTTLLEANYSNVLDYFRYGVRDVGTYQTWGTSYHDCYDLQGMMKKVLSNEDYARWQEEVAKVVTCRHADHWWSADYGGFRTYPIDAEQCCGMSMFLPLAKYNGNPLQFNEAYLDTSWAKDVWKE